MFKMYQYPLVGLGRYDITQRRKKQKPNLPIESPASSLPDWKLPSRAAWWRAVFVEIAYEINHVPQVDYFIAIGISGRQGTTHQTFLDRFEIGQGFISPNTSFGRRYPIFIVAGFLELSRRIETSSGSR